jgi:hypothetical protein
VASTATPPDLSIWLADLGLTSVQRDVRFVRSTNSLPLAPSRLRVEAATTGQGVLFAGLATTEFLAAKLVLPALAATVGLPAWRHYFAYDGEKAVATAAMFVDRGLAGFGWAYTLPCHRGQGAQMALLVCRIKDAAKLACDVVVAGTFEDIPERSNPSCRNLLRLGFRQQYVRDIYRSG